MSAGEIGNGTEARRMRALSYNIRHGEGMDGRIDLARIADVIGSVSPDVVSLQEVDCGLGRTEGIDQAEELARLTGMRVIFGPAIVRRAGRYGNAVLARLPVGNTENYPLPGALEPRSVLSVEVDLPSDASGGEPISFLATHFSLHEESRLRSASLIETVLDPDPGRPALLAGDLNARPESPTLRALCKTWTNATEGRNLVTVPAVKPRQIDYILFRPAERWRVIEAEVIDERVASDHCPIFAVLELLSP